MGRFSKDNSIEVSRFIKQKMLCAYCDKELVFKNYGKGTKGAWQAHHIDGDSDNNLLSNCAVLCINDPENCHLNVGHGGDFTNGELASRDDFTLIR